MGLTYSDPLTPEGCILSGTSVIAWDTSACDSSGNRSGQSATLSLWFKDLTPGTTYKATITYRRCSFALDEENNPIAPSCGGGGGCEELTPEEYEVITDEIEFVATDWGEILSMDCNQCEILYKKCELEDEANDWNIANPEETPRTVSCTAGGFHVPTASEKFTWFYACALEVVPPP